jgi:hypothetical protein
MMALGVFSQIVAQLADGPRAATMIDGLAFELTMEWFSVPGGVDTTVRKLLSEAHHPITCMVTDDAHRARGVPAPNGFVMAYEAMTGLQHEKKQLHVWLDASE